MTQKLAQEVVEPAQGPARGTVIWMHGLGADAKDFLPVIDRYVHLREHGIRFVFPNAPVGPVTINQGMVMRAWYDIYSLEFSNPEDTTGIKHSTQLINQVIAEQMAHGIASEHIILAGFSQGGAMALNVGLKYPQRLGGIVVLSGYLPMADRLEEERSMANYAIPIWMSHGLFDPVVPLHLGQKSKAALERLGYAIQWHTHPIQHTVCEEQIESVGEFLENVLFAQTTL